MPKLRDLGKGDEYPDDAPLSMPALPPGVAAPLAVPGGRALAIRDRAIVLVQADGAVSNLGIAQPRAAPTFRFFADDPDRMLFADATTISEIDLVHAKVTERVSSGLVMQSFAPIAGGFAVSPIAPWTGITLYDDAGEERLELALKRVATLSDICGGRALVVGLEAGDDEDEWRTLIVEVRDFKLVPLAAFREPTGNVLLDRGRILLDGDRGWMELTGVELGQGEPVESFDDVEWPAS